MIMAPAHQKSEADATIRHAFDLGEVFSVGYYLPQEYRQLENLRATRDSR